MTGEVDTVASLSSKLATVSDRLELGELLPQYAHIIDDQRWDDLTGIFVAHAEADYSSIGGSEAYLHGLESIRRWLRRSLGDRGRVMPWHYVTDTVISLGDSEATLEAYMHNRHLRVIGVYTARARRTAEGWRVTHLRLAAEMRESQF